jgi:hypothetical protein
VGRNHAPTAQREGSTSAADRATTPTGRTARKTAALIDTRTSARLFLCASMHRRFVDIPRDKALATGVISAATVSNYFKPQSPRKRPDWPLAAAEHPASVNARSHSSSMAAYPTFSPQHQQFMSEGCRCSRPQQPPLHSRSSSYAHPGLLAQSKRRSICLPSTRCRRAKQQSN